MSKTSNQPSEFDADIIAGQQDLADVFQERYAVYAVTTVTARAIPNIEDGLLPVMRRFLMSMYDENVPYPKFKKSAAFVGNTLA